MKKYFKKRMFLCTKTLKRDSGEVSFKKDKVYFYVADLRYGIDLVNEQGLTHGLTKRGWLKYFIEVKPIKRKQSS